MDLLKKSKFVNIHFSLYHLNKNLHNCQIFLTLTSKLWVYKNETKNCQFLHAWQIRWHIAFDPEY